MTCNKSIRLFQSTYRIFLGTFHGEQVGRELTIYHYTYRLNNEGI